MHSAPKHYERLGLTFHRTFYLNTSRLAAVLDVAVNEQGRVDAAFLRQKTNLGTIQIEAMPRYARGCNLLGHGSFAATPFGQLAYEHDSALIHPATQWLMHYHLSAPHGPGPQFWHYLVIETLRIGDLVSPSTIEAGIARSLEVQGVPVPGDRALGSTASAFLGSYSKPDGLSAIGLLAPLKGGSYRVQATPFPPPMAVAAALADYWAGPLGGRATVDLDELARPGGFFSLFFLGTEQINAQLQALQRARLVEVNRLAPPFQVVRLWDDPAVVVARLYEEGHSE
jgi:hypothetical protein